MDESIFILILLGISVSVSSRSEYHKKKSHFKPDVGTRGVHVEKCEQLQLLCCVDAFKAFKVFPPPKEILSLMLTVCRFKHNGFYVHSVYN